MDDDVLFVRLDHTDQDDDMVSTNDDDDETFFDSEVRWDIF